jgi:hypothetical protein
MVIEYRRSSRYFGGARFDEDDQNYAEEVANTYMQLLEPVKINLVEAK